MTTLTPPGLTQTRLPETPDCCQAGSQSVLEKNSKLTTEHFTSSFFMGLGLGRGWWLAKDEWQNDAIMRAHNTDSCHGGNGDRLLCQPECAWLHTPVTNSNDSRAGTNSHVEILLPKVIVASLVAQLVENPPAMQEAWLRSLG